MDLNQLYHQTSPLTQAYASTNKYTHWALTHGLDHYRLLDLGSIMRVQQRNTELMVPDYTVSFVNAHSRVLAIPNVVGGTITQMVLRALDSHEFITLTAGIQFPYRIGQLPEDRVYTDPIVVVEGTVDADVLASVEPNTVACLTSGLSRVNMEIITMLTNHVILAYDNDETGQKAVRRDSYLLRERGIRVSTLKHPLGHKDPGDVAQDMLEGQDLEVQMALMNYKVELRRLKE